MDVRWLQDFLTVAETGNFSRAAERRNASQAAFSRRIQSLEAWAGAALIDRGVYPAKLTLAGEQFRSHAAEIVRQVIDARTELAGDMMTRREHVRVALPYALATSQFARWWPQWTKGRALSCSIVLGNILELVTSLMSDEVDMMFCFESAQQPVHLDPEGFERIAVQTDRLVPFAGRELVARDRLSFNAKGSKPLPLLMYTPGVYFARLVELIFDANPQRPAGNRVIESDMADVLRDLALTGNGIAWLPESSLSAAHREALVQIGGESWTMPLSIIAFRRRANVKPAVMRLWAAMEQQKVPAPALTKTGRMT